MAFHSPECAQSGDAARPLDPYYQFLTSSPPASAVRTSRDVARLAAALTAHIGFFLLVTLVMGRTPATSPQDSAPKESVSLVWAPASGGGHGTGSGGDGSPQPARPALLVGRDAITVPVATPPRLDPSTIVDTPTPRLEIPAVPVASGLQEQVGAVAEVMPVSLTRGPGSDDGVGGRRGGGWGSRDGDRFGDGDRGAGDEDGFQPGNGVSWPRLVQEVKPNYTADAMRAQVQGFVELDIVVLPDGSVGRVRIVRSLDSRFGLDEEAIKAVRRWRFDPGRRLGKAVATRVGVELSFHLR